MKTKKAKLMWLAIIIIAIATPLVWNSTRQVIDDKNYFLDGRYTKLYDGKDAKAFFDEYVDLTEYKDIAYHFSDGGRYFVPIRIFPKSFSYHVVDVYYTEEKFNEIVDRFLQEIQATELTGTFNFFHNYRIIKDSPLYTKNSAFICFDTMHHTIRYFIVCNFPDGDVAFTDHYVRPLNWNGGKRDWIFDYPNPVDPMEYKPQ